MSLTSPPFRMGIVALSVFALDAITKVLALRLAAAGYGRGILLPLQNPKFSLGVATAAFPVMLALAGLGSVNAHFPHVGK